jgi:hypothetical protein
VQPTDSRRGCLVITSTDARGKPTCNAYLVHPVKDDGRLVGYRLQKADGEVYFLAAVLAGLLAELLGLRGLQQSPGR